MRERFDADGERWSITVDRADEAPGVHALVFHCVSNPQRPYRVARITDAEAAHDPDALGDRRLHELFEDSQVMDYVRNPDAIPERETG